MRWLCDCNKALECLIKYFVRVSSFFTLLEILFQSNFFNGSKLQSMSIPLGTVEHRGVCGFNTFAHIRNSEEVFENITNFHEEITNIKVNVKLRTYSQKKTVSELKENLCGDYFKRYFKNQAMEKPVVLPQAIPSGISKVVDTLESWCLKTNEMSHLKGLIIHSFDILVYFDKWLRVKDSKERLCKDLYIKEFPSTPLIIVYNPKENVILLIRESAKKDIRNQLELCSSDMKMFMTFFGDDLKETGVKVISLLVRNLLDNAFLNCEACEHSIVPVEALESYDSFQKHWDNNVSFFEVKNTNRLDKKKAEAFSAKFVGFLAAAQFFDNLPTFTADSSEQMEHALVMLTPEQREILYSADKHLIIKGPYGCGKTIIARKKLQILSEEFAENKKNEMVYFVCYDPRSALVHEIGSFPNVKVRSNKEGNRLSEIIKDINKEMKNENVNLIVDEYDSEDLDKTEAEILNRFFKGKFREAYVFLIPQSMEKNREVNKTGKTEKEEKNMFHLLETMKEVELNLVMRNPIEISNLIWVTQKFLTEEQTIYEHQEEKETSRKLTIFNERNTEDKQPGRELKAVKSSSTRSSAQITKSGDKIAREVTGQEQSSVLKIGIDEAFGLAKVLRVSKDNANKIVNSFAYKASKDTGHFIKTCNPMVFEMAGANTEDYTFEKLFAINYVLRDLNILRSNSNNKHVILHFNTKNDKIAKCLAFVFEFHKQGIKVTSNYEDFKYDNEKSVLVCNFSSFRGLEHSNIVIAIDHDIYCVQHYLVEAMARCTNNLAFVVLEKSETVSRIIRKWEDGLNGKSLIDRWKVQISPGVNKNVNYNVDEEQKLVTINGSSKEHEEMRKKFDHHIEKHHDFNIEQTAEELIKKR